MTDFDHVIAGGTIVTPAGPMVGDLATIGGTIAAVAGPGLLRGREVYDATGLLVLPGGIDPHIHCSWPIGGVDGSPDTVTAGPDLVSRAALWGGTTTLIDFAVVPPGTGLREACDRTDAHWRESSLCDYSFHVMLRDELSGDQLAEIPGLVDDGYSSYKVFTTNVRPDYAESRMVRVGDVLNLMRATARVGATVALHAEDDDLVMHRYRELTAAGDTGLVFMPEAHSAISEDLAFHRLLRLARYVPGVSLYFMHVSAAEGVRALEQARSEGMAVTGEALPQYTLVDSSVYGRPEGVKLHNYPSIKSAEDVAVLWRGIESGVISSFATDELCTSCEVKTQGDRIDNVTGGNAAVEPRLALVYDAMVNQRGLSLNAFVDAVSTNAARTFGMYPHKGLLAPGSDADICLFDPEAAVVLDSQDLHESDYTPWQGRQVRGWPRATMLRGRFVVKDGTFAAPTSRGRRVPRRPRPVAAG